MVLKPADYPKCDAKTGWGKFDLNVLPPNRLEVRLKLFFEVAPSIINFDIVRFLSDWQAQVSALWDGKIKLRSGRPPNEELTVYFSLSRVDNIADCHFPVYIRTGGYAAGSGVYFPSAGFFGGDKMHLRLGQLDNLPYHQGSSANIASGSAGAYARMFNSETDRVMAVVPGNQPAIGHSKDFAITMDRTATGWQISPGDTPFMIQLCAALAATPGGMPQPPVKISASSGAAGKALDIVTAVSTYMLARGVAPPSVDLDPVKTRRALRRPFRDPQRTALATIEVLPVVDAVKRLTAGMAVADYVVSAHEFGHLLGLVDEYLNYSQHMAGSDIMVKSQPAWDRLCTEHVPQITQRSWNDAFNDSMMSVGTTIYPAHAITIWDCLRKASQNDWTITEPR